MNSSEFQYAFGTFRLDALRREVVSSADGRVLDLKPRTFDMLLFLVEHPGRLLDKATLMKAIWPNTVVEENNLNQHVLALRRALAECDGANPYIVTVPRRGYQFVASVAVVSASNPAASPDVKAGSSSDPLAQQLYVQGRALAARPSESNLRMAISLFQEAATRDPGFARAFSASATANAALASMAYEFEGAVTRAGLDAERALAIEPKLAEAHAVLGFTMVCRCRLLEADSHYSAAIALDPGNAVVRGWRTAGVIGATGHMQRALEEHLQTYQLDPAGAITLIVMAYLHLQFDRDAEALQCMELASGIGLAGMALPIPFVRAQVAHRRGRYPDAARYMLQLLSSVARADEVAALVETVYSALAGNRPKHEAATAIRAATLSAGVALIDPVHFARPLLVWSCLLGDLDLAFDIAHAVLVDFRRSGILRVQTGFAAQLWVREMRPFRQDQRFQEFVTGLGMMEYWNQHGPPDHCELRNDKLICR